ncbi:ankyrin repeat domain-containing protein [Bailinhaonella thermotolerans]|uniref:ankyrin repeat domain-containing protein n=1 Tax=Bailinhaonella thermotolerans TaxID=1070861 RepID=UPI001F5B5B92|nr:ankyrin repeat domain-containing protein [Bailinhaonella thermotolerans]
MTADGWAGFGRYDWHDLGKVRARLEAGADPNTGMGPGGPLHDAVRVGALGAVAELARRVDDVDAEHHGRTPLWTAVFDKRPEIARALAEAGADPWRPMMNGWSPGRLSLAGPTPDLFPLPPDAPGLSEEETAAAEYARSLVAALGDPGIDIMGLSLACAPGITVDEAARRLHAVPADKDEVEEILEDPYSGDIEDGPILVVGATGVPGGCVLSQPWGYAASASGAVRRLSAGTLCAAMYANPSSGPQGCLSRDGERVYHDGFPGGGGADPDMAAAEILTEYLYHFEPVAFTVFEAGMRLPDARAVFGPPDVWLRLPSLDFIWDDLEPGDPLG